MAKPSAVVSIIPPSDWDKIVEFAKLPRGIAHAQERLKGTAWAGEDQPCFYRVVREYRLKKCRVNDGILASTRVKTVFEVVHARN